MTFVRFPPPAGPLILSTDSRAASMAGIASWSACRPVSRAARATGWWFVRLLGPRFLPLPRIEWDPPFTQEEWSSLMSKWEEALGEIVGFAVYERSQAERSGLLLLVVGTSGPTGFIKVRPSGDTSLERSALSAAAAARGVTCPRVIDSGEVGEWTYLVTTALPSGLHRPAGPVPVPAVAAAISQALAALPRPESVPPDWEPLHGDFGPWNLREHRGDLFLFDFEHAGWAPVQADLTFYASASAALGLAIPAVERGTVGPAAEYWLARLPERMSSGQRDQSLLHGMMRYLQTLSAG